MDVYLHIGAPGCGAGALTGWLGGARDRLAARGVALWTPPETRGGLLAGLLTPLAEVDLVQERRGQRSCGVIRLRLAELVRSGMERLVISEPRLLGAEAGALDPRGLWPHLDERLRRLVPALGPVVRRVGIGVRGYADLFAAGLAREVWRRAQLPAEGTLSALTALPRRWPDIAADVARAFPGAEVVVWPVERLDDAPDAQLAALTGDAALSQALPRPGDRPPAPVPDLGRLRARLRDFGATGTELALPAGVGPWDPFTVLERAHLDAAYAADLEAMAPGRCRGIRTIPRPRTMPLWADRKGPADHDPFRPN